MIGPAQCLYCLRHELTTRKSSLFLEELYLDHVNECSLGRYLPMDPGPVWAKFHWTGVVENDVCVRSSPDNAWEGCVTTTRQIQHVDQRPS